MWSEERGRWLGSIQHRWAPGGSLQAPLAPHPVPFSLETLLTKKEIKALPKQYAGAKGCAMSDGQDGMAWGMSLGWWGRQR